MKKLLLLLTVCLLAVGCAPMRPIEQLGIITTYGADLLDNGQIENTIHFTKFDPNMTIPGQSVNSISKTYKGGIDKANLKTSFELVPGQVRLKMFGNELAQKGVMRFLTTHFRDATEPANIYIAISETTAKDILNYNNAIEVDISDFLYYLIDNNIKREILPQSDLKDFIHKYNDVGIDPIQPLIKIENQRPIVENVALFKNDIYVDSLTTSETFLIKLLIEDFRAGEKEITLDRKTFEEFIIEDKDKHEKEDLHVVLSEINSNSKIELTDAKNLEYKLDIKFDSRLLEVSEPLIIENEKVLNRLEDEIAAKLKSDLEQLVEKLKELNVDPIGFGNKYNQTTRNQELTEEQWREMYPSITTDFSVSVNIIRYGLSE